MLILQSTVSDKAAGGQLAPLMLIIIVLVVACIALKKMGASSMAYCISRRYSGISSPLTTHFLGKVVKKMIKDEGYHVSKIGAVHQFGNCYHGIAMVNGEQINLSITADKYGNISFKAQD